ncbi:MAG: sodium/glutamate symporter [Geminicoccaceae bacterium]
MQLDVNVILTLVVAVAVLLVGRVIVGHVAFLNKYSIPDPVVGGLIAAVVITALRFGAGVQITFDMSLQTTLLLAFFSTIGLSADVRMLLRGGMRLVILLVVVTVFLVVQNALGVAAAIGLDMNPLIGLLAGTVTMSGGHGTGAAYAKLFGEVNNLQGAMEVAMACATFGLVMGGIIGGPVAERLINKHGLRGTSGIATTPELTSPGELGPDERRPLSPESFFETVALILVCVGVGSLIASYVKIPWFTLPTFVWCLLTGIVICNVFSVTRIYRIDTSTLELLGTVCLSLFLAMALMALKLWELVGLALPVLVILAAQTVLMAAYATYVTFPVMGRNYDAAVIAAGHCGFGLGATPTAIANMQAVTGRHGHSTLAFLLIPIIGAFLVDITNALVIQAYLALPQLGF